MRGIVKKKEKRVQRKRIRKLERIGDYGIKKKKEGFDIGRKKRGMSLVED